MPTQGQHPYLEFKNTRLWNEVAKLIEDLKENNDLTLTTADEYVVGYICKRLGEKGLVTKDVSHAQPSKIRSRIL